MARECPKCDGRLHYGDCIKCGFQQRETVAQFTGGAGVMRQPLSDEEYKKELRKLQR